MTIKLDTIAKERGTYFVVLSFVDEEEAAVIPDSLKWSLIDKHSGAIINGREDVVESGLAASMTIVLSNKDLALFANTGSTRVMIVKATYTSVLGAGLPLNEQIEFPIENFRLITFTTTTTV